MNEETAIKLLEESISNPYAFLTVNISREAVGICVKYTKEYSFIKNHLISMIKDFNEYLKVIEKEEAELSKANRKIVELKIDVTKYILGLFKE